MSTGYARAIMIGSFGESELTDSFTDGVKMPPNLQTISALLGTNRKAGMMCDNATSENTS